MTRPISLVRASMADGPRMVKLFTDSFEPYEPLYRAISAAAGDDPDVDDDDYEFALKYLPQGCSLLALDGDNLIGAAFNREVTSNEYNLRAESLASAQSKGEKLFFKFWTFVEQEAKFWEEGSPQKALDLHLLVVSGEARGRGIGKALIEESWKVAREKGYRLFRIDCSSYYSGRIAESLGMKCVYSLAYDNYKDETGETVFKIADPHKEFRIFKQEL